MDQIISVTVARERILERFDCLPSEKVHITEALGRVLASDILAPHDLPLFPNSAMDGYAVNASDVSDTPTTLKVIGDIRAGQQPALTVTSGTAARIMTGAPIPRGADAVVPVELTDDKLSVSGSTVPSQVSIDGSVHLGAYIRRKGDDIRAGERVLVSGRKLTPVAIGVLAALGISLVNVACKPKVAILATGDELVDIDSILGPGQIRNSNSYSLISLVRDAGGEALNLKVAQDTVESVQSKLKLAVEHGVDLILTSAGVSVGAKDVVRMVIDQAGELVFWKVNMSPGKPLVFGQYDDTPLLGLPGNPVSSIIAFEVFARPSILKLAGHANLQRTTLPVRLLDSVETDGRETYFRAVVARDPNSDEFVARSAGGQGSHMMQTLVQANALVIIPAGREHVHSGEVLYAWMLSQVYGVL